MTVYQLTSSKRVIAKVIADLGLQETDMRISDMREWIGEAVEKIGGVSATIRRVSGVDGAPVLKIHGHQAELPCDLHQLIQVAWSNSPNGPWLPMKRATGTFAMWGKHDHHHKPSMIVHDDVLVDLLMAMLGDASMTREDAVILLNGDNNYREVLTALINQYTVPTVNGAWSLGTFDKPYLSLQYNIKPGWVVTNIPYGYLKLSYNAVPTDEDGYPLVPDIASYMEACYWYITMKYHFKAYLQGQVRDRVYYDMRHSWNFYRQQAYAELMLPTIDELESYKNQWNRLIPDMNSHDNFFNDSNEPERLYGINRY